MWGGKLFGELLVSCNGGRDDTVLPNKWKAREVGAETAKILCQRIGNGSFRKATNDSAFTERVG